MAQIGADTGKRRIVYVQSPLPLFICVPLRNLRFKLRIDFQSPSTPQMSIPTQFENVTAITKANVYFEGRVVSHTVLAANGDKRTLGLIYPGQFHFETEKAERMEIVAGRCSVKMNGASASTVYDAGSAFDVAAKSGFDIEVGEGICEYICSFLD